MISILLYSLHGLKDTQSVAIGRDWNYTAKADG